MILGAAILLYFFPWVLALLGFTKRGIRKGSLASGVQSKMAYLNGGGVPMRNFVAFIQRVAAKGLGRKGVVVVGAVGAAAGYYVARFIRRF